MWMFFKIFGSTGGKGRLKSIQRKIHEENFLNKEPLRIPYYAKRFNRRSIGRCNGQKPKYKNVRRGLGRPTIDIMFF